MTSAMLWIPDASAAKTASRWTVTNRALRCLVDRHRQELTAAEAVAEQIKRWLQQIFPLMDELCRASCPWCPELCCIVNRVWFDFQDLLFMHLNRLPLPPVHLIAPSGDACPYLSRHGCRLPRLIRPWVCIQYICATQERILARQSSHIRRTLNMNLTSIKRARWEIEDRFVGIVVSGRDKKGRHHRIETAHPAIKDRTD